MNIPSFLEAIAKKIVASPCGFLSFWEWKLMMNLDGVAILYTNISDILDQESWSQQKVLKILSPNRQT